MKKTAFLFSGQGAQYPGMMRELNDRYPAAATVFKTADETLGRSISQLCFEGTQEELNLTHNTQPCILAADLAAFAVLSAQGIAPVCVAGFSLGEYAALTAAGVLDMADAFRLVQLRADAMQAAVPAGQGGMVSILGAEENVVQPLCAQVKSGYLAVANYNCRGQIVLSGEMAAVDEAVVLAKQQGLMAVKLAVSAPFHCALMEPAAQALEKAIAALELQAPKVPVYLNVDGEKTQDVNEIREKMVLQAKSSVYWQTTLQNMQRDGVEALLEVGPGKTLTGFAKRTVKELMILRVEDQKTLDDTMEKLG